MIKVAQLWVHFTFSSEGIRLVKLNMTLRRWQFQYLVASIATQICAAVTSTDVTLGVCSYASENFYHAINLSDPTRLFPDGYVECTNTTETKTAPLCGVCSCREKRVESVGGVTVAWVVCVGDDDATMCKSSGPFLRESCASTDKSFSHDSSGFDDIDVGLDASSQNGVVDGSNAFVEGNSNSYIVFPNSSANATIDTRNASIDSNATASPTKAKKTALPSKKARSNASVEVEMSTAGSGTIHLDQTKAPTPLKKQDLQPSDGESTQSLDTNNGSSSKADWLGTRLMAIFILVGAVSMFVFLAIIIAVRKDQGRKNAEVGTPTENEDISLEAVTQQFHGNYYPKKINRGQSTAASRESSTEDFVGIYSAKNNYPHGSEQQQRFCSEVEGKMSGSFARFESVQAGDSEVRLTSSYYNNVGASQLQFNTSHGPSVSKLPSPTPHPIYDTSNTYERFSSIISTDTQQTSERMFESEKNSIDSFRELSETSTEDRLRYSKVSTESVREEFDQQTIYSDTLSPIESFVSSPSSYEYTTRDTEASEHMHPSEMSMNSSRVAMSFDSGYGSLSSDPNRHRF